jgi:hypothetical protein
MHPLSNPLCFLVFLCIGLFPNSSQGQDIKEQIIGSWELVQYVDHQNNIEGWQQYGDKIIYQKHITDSHFVWLKYDSETDQLMGMGGGTYKIDKNGRYIENIDFFFPPGSSELGQSIPFNLTFEKGNWIHTGYAKNMDYTQEGEVTVTDSTKIEELWKPLYHPNNNRSLIGTWDLYSYRETSEGQMIEYPNFIVYMKLITPSHFVWVKYDNEGDQIYAAGSGPYTFDGNKYIEKVRITYPKGSVVNGSDITFNPVVSPGKWIHQSKFTVDGENLMIDELWVPKSETLEDMTDFIE